MLKGIACEGVDCIQLIQVVDGTRTLEHTKIEHLVP
jgi:hypothetical protein